MNAIQKALSEIKFNIPAEILNIAFIERSPYINRSISLDERILNSILRPRVFTDINLIGGITVYIPINYDYISTVAPGEHIVKIPKSVTNNRSIVSPLVIVSNIGSYNGNMSTPAYGRVQDLTQVAGHMLNSIVKDSPIQTARLELIGENTLLVQDPDMFLYNCTLKCVIEHDANMSSIHPRNYLAFSKLCILGTKSYIHNHLKVKLDQGYIYGGHELSTITDIVDNYADAEEMYQEYLHTTFRQIEFMNQPDNMNNFIKGMFGFLG